MFKCPGCNLRLAICEDCGKVFYHSSGKWYFGPGEEEKHLLYICHAENHISCDSCIKIYHNDDIPFYACPICFGETIDVYK